MSADSALRANVRLLGDLLGYFWNIAICS